MDVIYSDEGVTKVMEYLEQELGRDDVYDMSKSWKSVVDYKRTKEEVNDFVT